MSIRFSGMASPVLSIVNRRARSTGRATPDDRLVLVMTVNPLSEPDFAGSYAFSPDVGQPWGR